jgi:hypothetical protein
MDVLPTVPEDSSRQWTGDLLYSKDLASFGTIRLHIPESSIRIPKLPTFAGPTICLKKLVSAQYLTEKWLSTTAHPSKKPDCLIAEFANLESQTALVYLLQNSSSAALVIEENCTLIFFPKHNSRLRPLFNVDSSNNPIGVALLNPLENFDSSIAEPSHADEVRTLANYLTLKLLLERRLPYSSILSYDGLDSYIKDEEHYQFSWLQRGGYSYVLHSPPASLETDEMETFLYSRGGHPSSEPTKASVLLINRLYQSCLNYIPHLTTLKRRQLDWPPKAKPKSQEVPHKTQGKFQEVEIYLFGSYLDHQMEGDTMKPSFGNGLTRIFPGGGIICFTIDHLLEYPQHIKSIISYNVFPTFRRILMVGLKSHLEYQHSRIDVGKNGSSGEKRHKQHREFWRRSCCYRSDSRADSRQTHQDGVLSFARFRRQLVHAVYELSTKSRIRVCEKIHPSSPSSCIWRTMGRCGEWGMVDF